MYISNMTASEEYRMTGSHLKLTSYTVKGTSTMAKIKTSELTGQALDYAVAICQGFTQRSAASHVIMGTHAPSVRWAQAGPIIEQEKISPNHVSDGMWSASYCHATLNHTGQTSAYFSSTGPTPLIAAMRCYCCAKLGGEIDIPQELQPCQQLNI